MNEVHGVYHDELSLPLWAQRRLVEQRRERDGYRALLGQCREIARAAINSGDWVVDGARDPDMVFDRIDAALEGKTND